MSHVFFVVFLLIFYELEASRGYLVVAMASIYLANKNISFKKGKVLRVKSSLKIRFLNICVLTLINIDQHYKGIHDKQASM